MLVFICGPPSSGKKTVASYLIINAFEKQFRDAAGVDHAGGRSPEPENKGVADIQENQTERKKKPSITAALSSSVPPRDYSVNVNTKPRLLFVDPTNEDWTKNPNAACEFTTIPEVDAARRHFSSCYQLENFIMDDYRWQQNWVVIGTKITMDDLNLLRKRPFVLTVSVDAPIKLRHERSSGCFNHQSSSQVPAPSGAQPPTLAEFIHYCDAQMYPCGRESVGLAAVMREADVQIHNYFSCLEDLHRHIDKLRVTDHDRLRPSWDTYFMQMCHVVARRSNCMKRRVGCVLVRDKRIVTAGYNGTPFRMKNCVSGGCNRCNKNAHVGVGLDLCLCMHAEENALLEAGRHSRGATIYCTTFPCIGCTRKIIQSGVIRVVYEQSYAATDLTSTMSLFLTAGIEIERKIVVDCLDKCKLPPISNSPI